MNESKEHIDPDSVEHCKEELLNLINNIFTFTSHNNLNKLEEISNEFTLYKVLMEIEPDIESTCGKIQLTEDKSFGIRYGNMMSIIKCINNYNEQNSDKFKNPNSFRDVFIVNDIISDKPDSVQIVLLSEFLLLMSAISSQKEYFLDKLTTLEEDIQETYFNYIEKYIKTDDSPRISEPELQRRESLERNYIKMIEIYEKDQKKFSKLKEKEIESLNQKVSNMEKNIYELEMKYKDALREVEISKQNESKTNEVSFEESLKNNELKAKIILQKNEIEDLRRNNEEIISKYLEENNKLKEKIEVAEDKLVELNILKNENEKMKNKIKDYQKLKEKVSDYDNLLMVINSKSKTIESLQNDKKTLMMNLDKIQKELICEKDKSRNIEFEKKRIEIDLQEAQSLIVRLENRLDAKSKQKDSIIRESNATIHDRPFHRASINKPECYALDVLQTGKDEEMNEILVKELQEELEKLRSEKQELKKEIKELKMKTSSTKGTDVLSLELKNKDSEIDQYRKKLEEQTQASKKEYELISSSLYELALQFILMKNEMSKKLNPNHTKTWLDNERAKIFPLEK